MYGDSSDVVTELLALSCVDAGPYVKSQSANFFNDGERAVHRACRAVERGEKAISGCGDYGAVPAVDLAVDHLVDVRHAGRAHLRELGGIAGYPQRSESVHDIVESSHASSSLSWADGISRSFAMTGQGDRFVVAVVGGARRTVRVPLQAVTVDTVRAGTAEAEIKAIA